MTSRSALLSAWTLVAVLSVWPPGLRVWAQSPSPTLPTGVASRVMTAVRAAVEPALPFPASDEAGALPSDGTSTAPWMVRPLDPDVPAIEVLANPLNPANQLRSAKAMMQIQTAIEAAQRRSEVQYERALAESRRTGKSQDVDGVTLADEGVAGARIDADMHLTIEALSTERFTATVASSIEPVVFSETPGTVAVVSVPANVYRTRGANQSRSSPPQAENPDGERFCSAETWVFFGALTVPSVKRQGEAVFEVSAVPLPASANTTVTESRSPRARALVVRLTGNEALMADIVRKADWSRVEAVLREP